MQEIAIYDYFWGQLEIRSTYRDSLIMRPYCNLFQMMMMFSRIWQGHMQATMNTCIKDLDSVNFNRFLKASPWLVLSAHDLILSMYTFND